MATHVYVGTVKLSNGSTQKVTVQADTTYNATAMLETQYGKGKVFNVMRA